MGMVVREEGVDSAGAQALVHVGSGLAVVDENTACCGSDLLVVGDEPVAAVGEGACLPGVVRRRARDDHGGAFALEELRRVDEVGVEGLYGLRHAVVGRLAGHGLVGTLRPAVGAAVVGGG